MNNTLKICLSISSLKEQINAHCAWIYTTNIAVLPPIMNPSNSPQLDITLHESIRNLCHKFAGYIASSDTDEDIISIDMSLPYMASSKAKHLYQEIEKAALSRTLSELYSCQKQASHIADIFSQKHNEAITSIKQLIASTQ